MIELYKVSKTVQSGAERLTILRELDLTIPDGQFVAVAGPFANEPTILLADEPTGNLDSRNGRHVFDLMVEMNRRRGTTLVLVTHEHELARRADRQISLRDGQVVGDEDLRDSESEDKGTEEDRRTGEDKRTDEELEAARS